MAGPRSAMNKKTITGSSSGGGDIFEEKKETSPSPPRRKRMRVSSPRKIPTRPPAMTHKNNEDDGKDTTSAPHQSTKIQEGEKNGGTIPTESFKHTESTITHQAMEMSEKPTAVAAAAATSSSSKKKKATSSAWDSLTQAAASLAEMEERNQANKAVSFASPAEEASVQGNSLMNDNVQASNRTASATNNAGGLKRPITEEEKGGILSSTSPSPTKKKRPYRRTKRPKNYNDKSTITTTTPAAETPVNVYDFVLGEVDDLLKAASEAQALGRLKYAATYQLLGKERREKK